MNSTACRKCGSVASNTSFGICPVSSTNVILMLQSSIVTVYKRIPFTSRVLWGRCFNVEEVYHELLFIKKPHNNNYYYSPERTPPPPPLPVHAIGCLRKHIYRNYALIIFPRVWKGMFILAAASAATATDSTAATSTATAATAAAAAVATAAANNTATTTTMAFGF